MTTTTDAPTGVSADSADLNGDVNPGGVAVSYAFEYWLASKPHAVTFTPTVSVGSGIKTDIPLLVEITDLTPGAKYGFELLTSTGTSGSKYYPLTTGAGGVLTFKTGSAGKLSLTSTKLKVKKRRVSFKLKCASTLDCQGKLSITAKGKIGTKTETVACGHTSFTVAAGDTQKLVTTKVSKKCIALLNGAATKKIKAKLTAKLSTFQPEIHKTVSLTS